MRTKSKQQAKKKASNFIMEYCVLCGGGRRYVTLELFDGDLEKFN